MLSAGAHLGPYEVPSAIGAGGMGEVYKARDTRLARDVTIKILPAAFAVDPDRIARFQRKAKTLAALNHPNIGQIFGLEQAGDLQALAMELVTGENLSDRAPRGPISIDEALPIARQIAEALEPRTSRESFSAISNQRISKVRPEGVVKVWAREVAKTGHWNPYTRFDQGLESGDLLRAKK